MLKVKDEFDLKELEKFGFVENSYGDYEHFIYKPKGVYIDSDDRIIRFEGDWYDDDFEEIDILFYIIQAELVEKVENKD